MTILNQIQRILARGTTKSVNDLTSTRQLIELRKQIPSLYALLCVNATALAVTHYPFAPAWLTLACPGVLILLCMARATMWWRIRLETITEIEAKDWLRRTVILTALLSVAFVGWAMLLDGYGGPYEQGHVAIFVAITVVACIFCLTHLPTAAFMVTGIVMSVFLVHCLSIGNSVFVAIAINTAFVTVAMVRILNNNFRAFTQLVASQAEAQRLSEENARLAHTDGLTGLPNRRYFFWCLGNIIEQVEDGRPFALAIFDLDRFKPINDTFGHIPGDRVLVETGRRLTTFAAKDIIVARLGGDEFGLIIQSPASTEDVMTFCDRICESLQVPILLGEVPVFTGCSGGVALFPSGGRTANELFDRADYALYHSKEHHRGGVTLFSQVHEDAIRAERAVEAALRSADLAGEMEVHYQPILDTSTGQIASVEGLARWTSPVLGRVAPDRFIPAAERCGTIHALTVALLRKALADAVLLPPDIGLSFNLSAHDLSSSETVITILAAVRESAMAPQRLTLELTETALMRDFERASDAIAMFRSLGIQVALDDFGTGYSSLSYVHRLPLDKIKIDRSFVADIGTHHGRSVIGTVLHLCENLELEGIAEGVETPEQLSALRHHGCRYVQGYLIGKPMPFDQLLDYLRNRAEIPGARLCA